MSTRLRMALGLAGLLFCLGFSLWLGWKFTGGGGLLGRNDFVCLYSGARLVGTKGLYDPAKNREVQEKYCAWSTEFLPYARPPYYALLLRPLSKLKYSAAYAIWFSVLVAGFIGFGLLWRLSNPSAEWLPFCWSLPAFFGLFNGQDISLLLFWIALSAYLMRRNRPLAGGLVISLCASKFQLFLLLPLWILGRRLWRFGAGFCLGAAGLLGLSFLAAGPDWPRSYYALLGREKINIGMSQMPNLHALFRGMPHAFLFETLLSTSVAVAVVVIARKKSIECGLAAAVAGSLLVSYHSYVADCALLLPAISIVFSEFKSAWLRYLALVVATPACYIFLLASPPFPNLARVIFLLFIYSMAFEAWRVRGSQEAGVGSQGQSNIAISV